MTDSYNQTVLSCNGNEDMLNFVEFIHENTGAFGDTAKESCTVHVGGNSCEYIGRSKSMTIDDPVLTMVQKSDNLYVHRISVKRFANESRPAITVRVK